jgi:hypothetical protein
VIDRLLPTFAHRPGYLHLAVYGLHVGYPRIFVEIMPGLIVMLLVAMAIVGGASGIGKYQDYYCNCRFQRFHAGLLLV